MAQIWENLVCLLSFDSTPEIIKDHTKRKKELCKGSIENCVHSTMGKAYFKETNTTIELKIHYKFRPKILHIMDSFRPSDIVIFSIGLHYNLKEPFIKALDEFFHDLKAFMTKYRDIQFYYMESTPQHFPTPSGYKALGPDMYTVCQKIENQTFSSHDSVLMSKLDWRNHYLEQNLRLFKEQNPALSDSLHLLRIAGPLYSRGDAHMVRSPLFPMFKLDCTHWCSPSGVLDFISREIYNAIFPHAN